MFKLALIVLILLNISFAQIADASFFPSLKSLNPGLAHLRKVGFLSLDASKTNVTKHHDLPLGGLIDGVNTEVEIKKYTLFRAGKGGGLTIELLADQESGERVETLKTASETRTVVTNADSKYFGGVIDLGLIGVMVGKTQYDYFYNFRVGSAPNISAKDLDWSIGYSVVKIGSAFRWGSFSFGGFINTQKSDGTLAYTFYDPNTGNPGSTEEYTFTTTLKGFGAGIAHSSARHHFEVSLERMTQSELNKPSDFPIEYEEQPLSSRITLVAEGKVSIFTLGLRVRKITGNYTDLEDILSTKLFYEELGPTDERTETTFNFSFGKQVGLSYSAFISQSEIESEEESLIFANGNKYPASTKSKSVGINVSYIY